MQGKLNAFPIRNIKDLQGIINEYKNNEKYLSVYKPMMEKEAESGKETFFTVIMRTQGKRPETLAEALLSLSKQTFDDFEVLLMVHKATDENKKKTEDVLSGLPDEISRKVRVVYVSEGGRGTPLNYGISMAHGKYITMFDDDDIVYENWLSDFYDKSLENDTAVLRCFGVSQKWEIKPDGTYSPIGDAEKKYCEPFSTERQLFDNFTPITCVAVPAFCVREFAVMFDEELSTAEDWDFIMRCVFLCGVIDTGKTGFLYRMWQNSESSATLYSREEWLRNREKIIARFGEFPIFTNRSEILSKNNESIHRITWRIDLRENLGRIKLIIKRYISFKLNQKKYIKIIEASEYFDEEYYVTNHPDVFDLPYPPALHYLLLGWTLLYDPSEKFSTVRYLALNPDIEDNGMCPLLHYEKYGRKEGRTIE